MPTESKETREGKVRVAIYMRLSPATADKDGDFKRQQAGISKYLGENPQFVLWDAKQAQYIDNNSSGAGFQRKEVHRMLADAKSNLFSKVITYGIGRFGRNLVQSVGTMEDLKALGINYIDCDSSMQFGRTIHEDFAIKTLANLTEMELLRSKKKTQEKMDIIKDELKEHGMRVGSPSILDDWVESPRKVRADKVGLAVKPNANKKARFIQAWKDGIPRKTMAQLFKRPVNPKCKHCKGNPPRHTDVKEWDRKCKCGLPPTLKTIDMTRVRLELPQRKPEAFGKKKAYVPSEMLIDLEAPVEEVEPSRKLRARLG